VRKLVSFCLSFAALIGSAYVFYFLIFTAAGFQMDWFLNVGFVPFFFLYWILVISLYWIWDDYLRPN
jgi:hypothetical protein